MSTVTTSLTNIETVSDILNQDVSLELAYQDELTAFFEIINTTDPTFTTLSATEIGLSFGEYDVTVSGTGFDPVGSADDLLDALDTSIADGAFSEITVDYDGDEILSLDFGPTGYVFDSGDISLVILAEGPQSFEDIYEVSEFSLDFQEAFADLVEFGAPFTEDMEDYFLDTYSHVALSGLGLFDGDDLIGGITIASDEIVLDYNGLTLTIDGTFPGLDNVGELAVLMLELIAEEGMDFEGFADLSLSEIDDVELTGATLEDEDENVLASFVYSDDETPLTYVVDGLSYGHVWVGTNQYDSEILYNDADMLVLGLAGGDFLWADEGNDSVLGGLGDDDLLGWYGNDTLLGEDGNDIILGEYGDDSLLGGAGNDTLYGAREDDQTETGNDTLRGDAGDDFLYGGAGDDSLRGGDGNDEMYGGDDNDTLRGDDGDDYLYGEFGDDSLRGGDGGDTLEGSAGEDVMLGDDGNDYLAGEGDNDSLRGGTGDDTLYGGDQNDTLRGDSGDDTLSGGFGDDSLRGDAGNDTLNGGDGEDTLRGGDGENLYEAGNGNDRAYGGNDAETINGGEGDDLLVGGGGDDRVNGGADGDTLYGNDGEDTLNGEDGDDWTSGGANDDLLLGRAGDDTMRGSSGDDRFYGGSDNDVLAGNNGNDTINGGSGNDRMFGGRGNDELTGGAGTDLLNGGSGEDVFVFDTATDSPHGSGRDTISDFASGVDTIDLSGFDGTLTFVTSYTGAGNEVRYNSTVGRLYIDLDGDPASEVSIDLGAGTALVESDLIL